MARLIVAARGLEPEFRPLHVPAMLMALERIAEGVNEDGYPDRQS
jgi:hypothetical protein